MCSAPSWSIIASPPEWQLPSVACRSGQLRRPGHQIGRKGRVGLRKIRPVPRHRHARQFPMARRRVLAARHFGGRAPQARWVAPQPRRIHARGQLDRRAQTQPVQHRQAQRARPPHIRPPRGAGLRDMAQGVRARIAERIRIRRAAAPTESSTTRKARGISRAPYGPRRTRRAKAPPTVVSSRAPFSDSNVTGTSGPANSAIFWRQPPQGGTGVGLSAMTTSSAIRCAPPAIMAAIAPASAQVPSG